MIISRIKPITLAIALTGLVPMLAAPLASADVQEQVTVAPAKRISPREEAIISSAGVKVLRHIAQARADIHEKKPENAKTELGQAETLLDIIRDAVPTTKVKDRIWIAKKHLEYEDTQNVLPDLIPISSSLEELVDIMPVEAAKQHLSHAKEHLQAGNKTKAKEELEATDAALQYSEVDLPLGATRDFVAKARDELNHEKLDQADQTLKSAEDSVVYLSLNIQQPLLTARSLLWQTEVDLQAGHKDQARHDLQGAIGYLEMASRSNQKPTREAAAQLLSDARQLQSDLERNVDVGERVHHLWQRAQALADRSVEYMAAGWSRLRAENPMKSDIIEAKLHLTNARIDLFTGHESEQARQELATSLGYLDKALEKGRQESTQQPYVAKLDKLRQRVEHLSTNPDQGKVTQYLALEHQMREILRTL